MPAARAIRMALEQAGQAVQVVQVVQAGVALTIPEAAPVLALGLVLQSTSPSLLALAVCRMLHICVGPQTRVMSGSFPTVPVRKEHKRWSDVIAHGLPLI